MLSLEGLSKTLELEGINEVKGLPLKPEISVTICLRWSCQDKDKGRANLGRFGAHEI